MDDLTRQYIRENLNFIDADVINGPCRTGSGSRFTVQRFPLPSDAGFVPTRNAATAYRDLVHAGLVGEFAAFFLTDI